MTVTREQRRIGADPTSVALLLADPAMVELWPGVRLTGADATGQRLTVVLDEGCAPTSADLHAVTLRVLPPTRTPTAYVVRFECHIAGRPPVTGRLRLARDVAGDEALTLAELELTSVEPIVVSAGRLFLAALAAEAERRADAA